MPTPAVQHLENVLDYCSLRVLVGVDATVWPAKSDYLKSALDQLCTILNMSNHNLGHIQCPVVQAQTAVQTVLKHRRLLEDNLLNRHLGLSRAVTLVFKKDAYRGTDKRQKTQACYGVLSSIGVLTSRGFAVQSC